MVYKQLAAPSSDPGGRREAEAAVRRLAEDPKVAAAEREAEARKGFQRAENYLRNGLGAEAKQAFAETAKEYPDTEAGKQAHEKAAIRP